MPEVNRKLGRLPSEQRDLSRRLFLRDYAADLPKPPPAVNGFQKMSRLTMGGNDRYGDCVFVGSAHMTQLWTANESTEVVPSDQDIINAYFSHTNGQDIGAKLGDVLKLWQHQGILGHKIGPYVAVDPGDIEMVKTAIWFFGGLWTGLGIPKSWVGDLSHWAADNAGSTIAGGHCVDLCSYDDQKKQFGVYTWAHNVPMSFAMLPRYFDELYAVLSPDWCTDGTAPNGLDMEALKADLQKVQMGVLRPSRESTDPEWVAVPASRSYNGVADDVRAHGGGNDSPHEGTHQINSVIRNRYQGRMSAVYVLNDIAAVVENPSLTLTDLAHAVPADLRGDGYQLYLVDQAQYWNDWPCYVLDEWSAYIIGALGYREAGDGANYRLSKERAREFANYVFVLLSLVQNTGYDATQLDRIYGYLLARTSELL